MHLQFQRTMMRILAKLLNWLAPEGWQDANGFHFGKPLLLLLLLAGCASAPAADYWWTNSQPAAATYQAGDTVHLVGTFTNALTITNSGSTGSPVTFHFETGAQFSAPTLGGGASWITLNSQHDIVIDGGQNGLLQCTDNGSPGYFDFANKPGGIWGAGTDNNIAVKNLAVLNLYNRATNTDPVSVGGSSGIGFNAGSGILISNCFVSGAQNGIEVSYSSTLTSNLTVIGCTVSNFDWGIAIGAGAVTSPVFDNLIIRSNYIQAGDAWETNPNGPDLGFHRDPIILFNESSDGLGCISNIEISFNFISSGWHPQSFTAGTAAIFIDLYRNDQARHMRVFNNISTLAYPLSWSGGGGMMHAGGTDVLLANNTCVDWYSGGSYGSGAPGFTLSGTNAQAFNNILVSKSGAEAYTAADTSNAGSESTNQAFLAQVLSGLHFDYNIYNGQQWANTFNIVVFQIGTSSTWYNYSPDTWAEWQQWYNSFDPHSLTNTVQLAANFAPLTNDTVAIGNGTNLTAFGITNDFAGNPRPATGPWTIGAWQVAFAPPAPTGHPGGAPWFW